ncbi:MAG: ArsR/SmtB family transcription factor [Vulcanibacillus sp.]
MDLSYADYVIVFKALADETRLKIIDMLSHNELCACKILEKFNITQPTLSYHMKILTESELVIGVRDGAWMRYSLNQVKKKDLESFLMKVMSIKRTEQDGGASCVCETKTGRD